MRILLLTHSFNSLTQRLFCALAERGHELSVEFDIADAVAEEAVALLLPIGDGQTRPFSEATIEEVRAARRILKAGQAQVQRELKPEQQAVAEAARQLEAKIEQAAEGWLTPKQVIARRRGDEVVFDLRGVRGSDAWKLFATLASALPPE